MEHRMSDGDIVVLAVGISVGVCCFAAAIACWWKGVKAKYDPVFVGRVLEVDDDGATLELDEKALRRMMKQTSKEMDWTKVRWG
jgi:hypothetical protein